MVGFQTSLTAAQKTTVVVKTTGWQ